MDIQSSFKAFQKIRLGISTKLNWHSPGPVRDVSESMASIASIVSALQAYVTMQEQASFTAGISSGIAASTGTLNNLYDGAYSAPTPISVPPSIAMCCPVIHAPAGEARKTAAPAISSGSPNRRIGS